jgi:hypothetical protein
MRLKVIRTSDGILVNVCDSDIIDMEFREGDVVLRTPSSFYGEEAEEEEIRRALSEGDIISLVGEKSIRLGLEMGLLLETSVKRIQGIPFINIYRL